MSINPIIEAYCRKYGVANLYNRAARYAREAEVKFVLNTDAQLVNRLGPVWHVIGQARWTWLEAGDVLDTQQLDDRRK